jgi:hypothetical protein
MVQPLFRRRDQGGCLSFPARARFKPVGFNRQSLQRLPCHTGENGQLGKLLKGREGTKPLLPTQF